MLMKLLKYDLRWIYKVVAVFYCLALFFSITSFCLSNVENSVLFSILYNVSNGFALAMVANCIINCLIRAWVRFRNNIYKDEAYLTHTIPVSRSKIYLSKVLAAIICMFTSVAVSAFCLFVCYYNNESIADILKTLFDSASDTLSLSAFWLFAVFLAEIFFQLVFILLLGYNGIILGHKSNKNKMLNSIIIGFAMYMIFNMVSVTAVFAAGLFNNQIMNLIKTSDAIDTSVLKDLLLCAIALYAVYNVVLYIMGSKLLKKGVDIE